MQKCLSCGGVYEPVQADGLTYFHKCPPLSVAEVQAAVTAGKVALPIDPVTNLPETPAVAVTRRTYERQTARDENVDAKGQMKAAGAGVQPVAAPPPPIVKVP